MAAATPRRDSRVNTAFVVSHIYIYNRYIGTKIKICRIGIQCIHIHTLDIVPLQRPSPCVYIVYSTNLSACDLCHAVNILYIGVYRYIVRFGFAGFLSARVAPTRLFTRHFLFIYLFPSDCRRSSIQFIAGANPSIASSSYYNILYKLDR